MKASMINFNAAGASSVSSQVIKAQIDYIEREQQLGGYYCAQLHQSDWEQVYTLIGALIHSPEHQIALQESASRAMLNSLLSIPWQQGDEVVVSEFEYGANFVALLQLAEKYQLVIKVAACHNGVLDPEEVVGLITDKTRALLMCWVPSQNGVINPVEAIGQKLGNRAIYYLVDACQAVGQLEVDVERLRCDFLVATGRKFLRAPRGTGFLYVSRRVLQQNLKPEVTDHNAAHWVDTHQYQLVSSARRFELFESSLSARMGLKVALESLGENPQQVYQQLASISQQIRDALKAMPQYEVCDTGEQQSAIITLRHRALSAQQLYLRLLELGFVTSVVTESAGLLEIRNRCLPELLRISPHIYNSQQDIRRLLACLNEF